MIKWVAVISDAQEKSETRNGDTGEPTRGGTVPATQPACKLNTV